MHYLLFYEYIPDCLKRRGDFRDEHMALAKAAIDRGEFVPGGVVADPAVGAVLIFNDKSPSAAGSLAKADPGVINGLVKSWYIHEWMTVAGKNAANPVITRSSLIAYGPAPD